MTYQELLQTLADKATINYKEYLQSKIDGLANAQNESLADQIQLHKDASAAYEKKFAAVLATVKNGEVLDQMVSEEELNNFLT